MQFVLLFSLGLLLSSCTHTINFRTSHFSSPVTGENQWSGHIAAVASSVTKVTVINDVTTNPPTRTSVDINNNIEVGDFLLFNNMSVDFSLSLLRSLDFYIDGSLTGVRWQFLNQGSNANVWVGSLQGAYGEWSYSTSSTSSGATSSADSKIKTSQAGLSIGYKFTSAVPYISYIHENHEVSTKVVNASGAFGPYSDKGTHKNFSVGLSSHGNGFRYALEYNMINISWDRSEPAYQNAAGVKLGFAW